MDLVKRFGLLDGSGELELAPVWMIAMMAAAEEDPCQWLRGIPVLTS